MRSIIESSNPYGYELTGMSISDLSLLPSVNRQVATRCGMLHGTTEYCVHFGESDGPGCSSRLLGIVSCITGSKL